MVPQIVHLGTLFSTRNFWASCLSFFMAEIDFVYLSFKCMIPVLARIIWGIGLQGFLIDWFVSIHWRQRLHAQTQQTCCIQRQLKAPQGFDILLQKAFHSRNNIVLSGHPVFLILNTRPGSCVQEKTTSKVCLISKNIPATIVIWCATVVVP